MTFFLIHAVKLIIELIKMGIIFYMFTGFKATNKIRNKLMALSVFLITNIFVYINPLPKTHDITVIISLSVMIITMLIFQGKILKKFLIFFVFYLVICIFDMFFDNLAWLVYSSGVENYFAYIIRIVISELTSLLLLITVCIFIKKKNIKMTFSIKSYLMLIFCSIMLSGFTAYSRFVLINNDSNFFFILNILFSIMWLVFLITIFLFIYTQIEKEKYKAEMIINKEIGKGKEEYYKMVSEKNNMLLGFKHDYSEHMKILKMLISKNENIKAQEYINKILEHSNSATINVKTGNIIINAIVCDCLNKFKNENIGFACVGEFPESVSINSMDMCTIFSNLLLNSFEAASKCTEDKYVFLSISELNDNYFITIKNTHNIIFEEKSFLKVSTKTNIKDHGIGIKNVIKILGEYKGKLEYEIFEKEVITKILVNL